MPDTYIKQKLNMNKAPLTFGHTTEPLFTLYQTALTTSLKPYQITLSSKHKTLVSASFLLPKPQWEGTLTVL